MHDFTEYQDPNRPPKTVRSFEEWFAAWVGANRHKILGYTAEQVARHVGSSAFEAGRLAGKMEGTATSWGFPFDPPKGAAQGGCVPPVLPPGLPPGLPPATEAPGLPPAPALDEPAILALVEFRGRLMIATSAGLFELDPMANTAYRVPLHNDTTRSREG